MSPQPWLYEICRPPFPRWIICDRDGTLVRDPGYVHRAEDLSVREDALEALSQLQQAGWGVAIATNQSGVARGYFSEEAMMAFNRLLVLQLNQAGVQVAAIAVCPHHSDGVVPELSLPCRCRKPGIGLLEALARYCGFDREGVVMVGDMRSDAVSAEMYGVPFHCVAEPLSWHSVSSILGSMR